MVANPARGQLNRKRFFLLSPLAPANLVSRYRFASPVPSRPVSARSISTPRMKLVFRNGFFFLLPLYILVTDANG